MSDEVGFVTMGKVKGPEGEIPPIGIGMIGAAFMGKAHSNAWKKLAYMVWPPAFDPKLIWIVGLEEDQVREACRRFGYKRWGGDWRAIVEDPEVQIVDIGAPTNVHPELCLAAAKARKHIICEKPLARTAEEAKPMVDAVREAGVHAMCAFNYRFVPAIRLAKQILDSGRMGQMYHIRARYLQEWIVDPSFPWVWRLSREISGAGALGDLGTHIIDLTRYLAGEPATVSAITRTFIKDRIDPSDPSKRIPVDVDDAFAAVVEYQNGAIGTLEASRFAPGRKNFNFLEINCAEGSLYWDVQDLNRLHVHYRNEEPKDTQGFHDVLVSESYHPFWENWWPQGHIIGWEHLFVHEFAHFLTAIKNDTDVTPHGANFVDGYRAAVVADAIEESAATGRKVDIKYER